MGPILLWTAAGVGLLATGYVISIVDDWSRDFTQNRAELDADATDPLLRPVASDVAPRALADRLIAWVDDQPHWKVATEQADENAIVLKLERITGLMRYVDDITVSVMRTDRGCRLEAVSQSRVGKGDLGQNPRNLKELTGALRLEAK